MLIGYARISTDDQNLNLQYDALNNAGCDRIIDDQITGSKIQRPGLEAALEYVREGDVFVVWRIDRLSRSLKDLIEMITLLDSKKLVLKVCGNQLIPLQALEN
ncbi:recombinase family protein [Legionella tucsonensis]|uniref:DNA-invertase n=1 Tax=Legionella tucsonensis TaxID=40335 RepID=A0A0W0ZZE4_9GAMM|nr:recombinase family protein [Legionella tucsonensis]KTD74461.1 DNA-invertase [Legionella tucsonensis]